MIKFPLAMNNFSIRRHTLPAAIYRNAENRYHARQVGRMIILFTDFGIEGPYLGQLQAVLHKLSPGATVINLISNAPQANPELSSYLLAALRHDFPCGTLFLAVVDPGVGGARLPVVLKAGGQFFVGPENGLFNTVAIHSSEVSWQQIIWQPENCSMSFHGRDLFAPVAANIFLGTAKNMLKPLMPVDLSEWQADLCKIIYFDHFGNAFTGIRYQDALLNKHLQVGSQTLQQAQTFSKVKKGRAFWYKNACGLVEIAVNQGNAQQQLHLQLGQSINFL